MYLPGVGDKTKATVITVTAGAAAMPDLKLPPDPAPAGFKVSGRVMGSPVVRSGGILIVRLANNAFPPSNGPCRIIQTNVAPDGAFEFRNIPPCAYTATVNANYGDTGRGAFPGVDTSTRVDVVDKDITGIFLGPGGLGAVPAPTPVTVAPSGRPMLLETRLGMVPRPPLATAKDCGHVPKEPAQAVVSCVEAALGARAPFIASFEMKGIDSQIVTGLAGTPPDVVQVLFVQSSAGGAPKVSAPNDCPNPKLTVVSGSVQIACN
jgi:hypothetical protein